MDSTSNPRCRTRDGNNGKGETVHTLTFARLKSWVFVIKCHVSCIQKEKKEKDRPTYNMRSPPSVCCAQGKHIVSWERSP